MAEVFLCLIFRNNLCHCFSGNEDHQPTEKVHVNGKAFEEQVSSLVKDVFEPAGLKVEKFTRLPYLCEGDMSHSYYWLNDVVFVLRAS